jgi:2,4-dienoyl-CoA reductase-like NADH-dependent reductase (Old Yellow Enzyme family)
LAALTVPNRIFVTAMGVSLAEEDGTVGKRLIDYHVAHARGGAGMIVTGVMGVAWPVGAVQPKQTAISDDRFLPGPQTPGRCRPCSRRAHCDTASSWRTGGRLLRRGWPPTMGPRHPPVFSGDFPNYFLPEEMAAFAGAVVPEIKILTKEDIAVAVQQFAAAAARAKAAGFDGIEVHGAHGYLLSSFMSPATNTRTDEYGGDLKGRARLLLEVVRAVRDAVGPDFPMWVKIDSREMGKKNGITIDHAVELAPMVEAAGADGITVSAYHDVGQGKLHSASNIPHEPGIHLEFAAAIRKAVNIPVIASGRVELDRGRRR